MRDLELAKGPARVGVNGPTAMSVSWISIVLKSWLTALESALD